MCGKAANQSNQSINHVKKTTKRRQNKNEEVQLLPSSGAYCTLARKRKSEKAGLKTYLHRWDY